MQIFDEQQNKKRSRDNNAFDESYFEQELYSFNQEPQDISEVIGILKNL